LGVGVDVLMGFAYVLVFISALSIFIALYNSLKERQYDLAIMRSMGASRAKLFFSVIMEGGILTLLASIGGLLLGHAVMFLFTVIVPQGEVNGVSAFAFYPEEFVIILGSVSLGVVCSLLPAWQAYRKDIHRVLAG
jgi:putative ABC transport system permease protein